MNWDTEREALANTLLDHIHTLDGRCACGHTYSVASPQNVADHVVAAILADFLPAHDKRVRAEQREKDAQIADDMNDHWVADTIREASDD